jgi:hypothetical protein
MDATPSPDAHVASFNAHVLREVTRQRDAIEEAAERSLLTGEYGVKVVRNEGRLISAEPDPSVPYGEIHEYPNGCAV